MKIRFNIMWLVALGVVLFAAASSTSSVVRAQGIQRTFAATSGNDANTASGCSRQQPCRSLGAAIGVVAAGGEVVVLDSGGYGAFAVTKAVQVIAPTGVYAGVTFTSGNGVAVNAGASDVVVLRGLTINALGGNTGISYTSGQALHIEGCIINGVSDSAGSGRGINVTGGGRIFIKDTTVRNGAGGRAISFVPASGTVVATLDRVRLDNNAGDGIYIGANAQATVRDSMMAGAGTGIGATATGSAASLILENSTVSGYGTGVASQGAGATARLSSSTVTKNGTGLSAQDGGALLSRTSNTVEDNATDGTFSSNFTAK